MRHANPFQANHINATPIQISERNGIRYLHLARDDVQSAMRINSPNTLILRYSQVMMGILLFIDPQAVVLIGLGGGSLAKFIYHYVPNTFLRIAEPCSAVIRAAQTMFFLPQDSTRLIIYQESGEIFIPTLTMKADIIFHDAFSAHGVIDALVSEDFLNACYHKLTARGALVMNLWGSDRQTPLYLKRIHRVFSGNILILPAFPDKNQIIYAFKEKPTICSESDLYAKAQKLERRYPLNFSTMVTSLTEYNDSYNINCLSFSK